MVVFSSFKASESPSTAKAESVDQLDSISADSFANFLYPYIDFTGSDTFNKKVFKLALNGYSKLLDADRISNDSLLTIIDYSLSSKKRRLWVLNLVTAKIELNEWVAHGKYSGAEYARKFSNRSSSKMSSIGFMVTGKIYNGKHKESLKLKGMEPYFNSNVHPRGVVIHGANYVREEIAYANMPMGRSFGCPAVRQEANYTLINLIHDGVCVFAYYPYHYYLSKSKYVNFKGYMKFPKMDLEINTAVNASQKTHL